MRTGIVVLSLLAVVAVASAKEIRPPPQICPTGTDGIVTLLPGTPLLSADQAQTAEDCFRFNFIHTATQQEPMSGDNWDALQFTSGKWNFVNGEFNAVMTDGNNTFRLSSTDLLPGGAEDEFRTVGGNIKITSPILDAVFTCFPTLWLDSEQSPCMRSNGVWRNHLSLWCGDSPSETFEGITLGIDFRFDLGPCEPFVPDFTCADWHADERTTCGLNLAYVPERDDTVCGGGDACIAACCVPDLCPESTSTLLTLRPVGPPSAETLVKAEESQIAGLDDCFNWNLLHTATQEDPVIGENLYNYNVVGGSWDYASGVFKSRLISEIEEDGVFVGVQEWTFDGTLFPSTTQEGLVKRLVSGQLTLLNTQTEERHEITCHAELYDDTFYDTMSACMRSNTYLDNYISLWCADTQSEVFENARFAIDFRFAWTCDACRPYKVDCGCKKVTLPAGSGDGCNCLEFRSKEESLRDGTIDCIPTKDEL